MTRKTVLAVIFFGLCTGRTASAEIIHVPKDYSTIQSAINAASNGDEIIVAPGTYTGAVDFLGKSIILRSSQGFDVTVIKRSGSHNGVISCVSGETPETVLQGFTIAGSGGSSRGMRIAGSSPSIVSCEFKENHNGETGWPGAGGAIMIRNQSFPNITACSFTNNNAARGGALHVRDLSSVTISSCAFIENFAAGPGGAIDVTEAGEVVVIDCLFLDNSATGGGGIFAFWGSSLTAVNCAFIENAASAGGGGIFPADGSTTLVNCVFDRNTSSFAGGGALIAENVTQVINCVFVANTASFEGGGLYAAGGETTVSNSIAWANTPEQILGDSVDVSFSDVLGGWPGVGNIDADPLFVQPGTGDLRLSFGSPCVNEGNNDALPPDEFDLDGDGDTDEPIPIDLAGVNRVQSSIVDMGAYEGEFDPQASGDGVDDLDQGEVAMLVPCGGEPVFLESAVVYVVNESGPDNASFVAECIDWDLHPDAGGFGELDTILRSVTSLQDGEFLLRAFLPFDDDILQGTDPLMLNMAHLDPGLGDWRLAVAGNTQNSPGHEGPVGDRIAVENSENDFGLSTVLGDYGVFWNPSLQKGFVWANTDHAGDVGFGATLCAEDCGPVGGDGVMNAIDLEHLLNAWGPSGGGGPCDIDQDGQVGPFDLALLLNVWGPCSPGGNPARWQPAPKNWGPCPFSGSCVGDLNSDGEVGPLDLATMFGLWGPCSPKQDCVADLDGDETVGRSDLAILLGESRTLPLWVPGN